MNNISPHNIVSVTVTNRPMSLGYLAQFVITDRFGVSIGLDLFSAAPLTVTGPEGSLSISQAKAAVEAPAGVEA